MLSLFKMVCILSFLMLTQSFIQEQYIFIHDTILDYIKCGSNEVDAVNLKSEMSKLSKSNAEEETGYEEKFKVRYIALQIDILKIRVLIVHKCME